MANSTHSDDQYVAKKVEQFLRHFKGPGSRKCIIKYERRHRTDYYDGTTLKIFLDNCLFLLRVLYNDGYFDSNTVLPPAPGIDLEAINSLPNGVVRDLAVAELNRYHEAVKRVQENQHVLEWVRHAHNISSGEHAYVILDELVSDFSVEWLLRYPMNVEPDDLDKAINLLRRARPSIDADITARHDMVRHGVMPYGGSVEAQLRQSVADGDELLEQIDQMLANYPELL